MQYLSTQALINDTEVEYKLLKGVETIQALGKFGVMKEHPRNKTDTITFSRLNPFNMSSTTGAPQIVAQDFIYAEGATPDINTISYTDVTCTLNEYDVLFKYSNKTALMHEHKIPDDMIALTARTMAEVAELVAYGQFKAGTSVVYANGSTRAGLNQPISLNVLRQAVRAMDVNRATEVTTMIGSGPNFGTGTAPGGYICFVSSDGAADARDLDHFVPCEAYGTARKKIHPKEIGACEEFTFIKSPLFTAWLASGDTYDGTMYSAAAAANDVYPMIVMGADAWGHVSLKGRGYTGIRPVHVPWDQASHYNPARKFGFVGATFDYNAVRLNEFWMQRIEACVSKLN